MCAQFALHLLKTFIHGPAHASALLSHLGDILGQFCVLLSNHKTFRGISLFEQSTVEECQTIPTLAQCYTEPALYLQGCERRNNNDAQRKFSLKFALDLWQANLPSGWLYSQLGMKPRCLIQGCASANNVDSLVRFLYDQGIQSPEIHVIDLLDLVGLGYADPRASHHQINAANLSPLFADGSVDLVVQDHLLNCAPICYYDAILSEISRVLSPAGLALLHYTDPSRFPRARGNALKSWLNTESSDYCLNMTEPIDQSYFSLPPAERLIETAEGVLMATLPLGNLEHFIPFERFEERLTRAHLQLEVRRTINIVDGEGLDCQRNHCLAIPCHR